MARFPTVANGLLLPPDLRRYVELCSVFTRQNVQIRYRGSALGVLWSLLNPLAMTTVYVAIFGVAFGNRYGQTLATYAISVFTGLLVVNFVAQSTTQALASVVGSASLLQKIRLAPSVLPVAAIATHAVQFVAAPLPLLVLATLVVGGRPLDVPLLVVPVLAMCALATGVGLVVGSGYVFFRDLPYVYEVAMFLLWIVTPVFYPIAIVPSGVRPILEAGPLFAILAGLRGLVLGTSPRDLAVPLATGVLQGVAALALGVAVYAATHRRFADLL